LAPLSFDSQSNHQKEDRTLLYRTLGRTNLKVSALALGTVELGMDYGIRVPGHYGRPTEDEAISLVHAAMDGGINLIDTARGYGASESVLGKALQGRREQVVLATKVSTQGKTGEAPVGAALRRQMLSSLETSLQELQTEWVDIWQIHNLDQPLLEQLDLLAEVFDEVRRQGKVRWVGASTYGVEMPLAAVRADLFDLLQVTYSVLDQRLGDEFLPLAAAHNIGVVVRSVLLQGVLTERGDYLPDHLETLRSRSRQFRRIVADQGNGMSPAQAAIAFGLNHPQIGAVLLGVRSQEELVEGLHAVSTPLEKDFIARLRELRLDDPELLNPGTWNRPS
jgi:1-deoxyxylulose-5-phosphate synthase